MLTLMKVLNINLVTNNLKENPLDNAFIEENINMADYAEIPHDDIVISDEVIDKHVLLNPNLYILINKEKEALQKSKKVFSKVNFCDLIQNVKFMNDKLEGMSKIKKLKNKLRRNTSQEVHVNSNIIK
jgi:hypothetical protein